MNELTDPRGPAVEKRRKSQPKAPKGRVTMTDIARAAGCSQATVSFVLNDTPGIRLSQQTRERVIEAARALGYSAPAFSALRTPVAASERLDGVIGFAVDQLATSPEAVVAIEGARQASWNAGNVLLVAQTLGDAVMEPRALDVLTSRGISALIYMTIFTREIVAPDYLYGLDIPVILLNCYTSDYAFPAVVPSEIAGGQSSTRHLIEHGHRRIATITGEPWMQAAQDRLKGYRRALATADIPFDPELVVEGDWSASAGYAATVKLLALKDRPTAIFCQNDRTAIGCYEALKEAGLHIPQDISVVGYDDEEIARHLFPPLTTSILPHMAMGQWAIEQLDTPPAPGKGRYPITKLECPLVERESVGAVAMPAATVP
ncbi:MULTISPECIES: LacI family DNA-binding transcriptional regulator [unclassified Mesorhizobium]|uniref:LacI family DNA-binding transcriptional regulator n=1 Tax=unclassified Mesorhizobium TaxID=325217 RepID=UPI00086F33C3|nr:MULTISPECIES: LacI family DNA-binding transcriptional regulator [unclassified Mesorhizobium]MBN9256066.1 LacI family DNA-binding transcriptional regulator [Mesorhizobium sp.]ODT13022.1 MAG: LacI family transcriptional regulator [Mesorhizobium sp. SCN 65-12]OJX83589.1 MAG: LacI family transcriptional regulator [Mesorhizobium sp. 65-26]